MTEQERQDWHRLFGAFVRDHLAKQPVTVETEYDLSLQQQLLDVVIIRKTDEPLTIQLPSGFEQLPRHVLIRFKSHQETLDAEAMDELISHYVNYRKMVSPRGRGLPHADFGVYALSVRFPRELDRVWPLRPVTAGVYASNSFSRELRVVVVHELPHEGHNALLHLFSARAEALAFAREHYRAQSNKPSGLLAQLLGRYLLEGVEMPLDMDKWVKELEERLQQELLAKMTPEQRVEVAKALSPEQRIEVAKTLSPEERAEVANTLSAEQLEELLRQKKAANNPTDPK